MAPESEASYSIELSNLDPHWDERFLLSLIHNHQDQLPKLELDQINVKRLRAVERTPEDILKRLRACLAEITISPFQLTLSDIDEEQPWLRTAILAFNTLEIDPEFLLSVK